MELSPEERRKIYEEEKARIEAEQREPVTAGGSTTGLEQNTAGLLCYLGFWISGIIFLVIEQENKFVRFHALQSIVTFGALSVALAVLGWIPYVGTAFRTIIGIMTIVMWILLMVKAHQGELYKVPLAGQVAEEILPAGWRAAKSETGEEQKTGESTSTKGAAEASEPEGEPPMPASEKSVKSGRRKEDYFVSPRADRVAGYSVVIFFNVALLVFFSFFHRYIAWYSVGPDGGVTRLPILTDGYFTWLPILVTALVVSIAAHIVFIIRDRYWLRETIQIALTVFGVVVVASLVAIFPFDFSVIPNPTVADIMPAAVTFGLIIIAFILGVMALVRFIKLMLSAPQ